VCIIVAMLLRTAADRIPEILSRALRIVGGPRRARRSSTARTALGSGLSFCAERDVAYVPFFPIGSPFTGGPRPLAEDPTISSVAAKHAATHAQIAIAWLLHKDEHVLLIPGTSSVTHLEQNMAAGAIALDGEDLAALDRVAARV
jgi:diketogulonate reductase-like aldo/keto reductase